MNKGETARATVQRYEELSKVRALTEVESLQLEMAIARADGVKPRYGLNKELAKHGIRRDMTRYRRRA